jgi:predicted transcriptional regulator
MQPGIAFGYWKCHICAVTSVAEIQEAIERLSAKDKAALTAWLESQEEPAMSDHEEAALLASLKKAERELDSGQGVPIEEVRTRVAKWGTR